ncbi:MAG: S46 family peptidase [Bacteroidales bacterium]|nr:S46 family peptidase [Bacteroidales bacterium]
MKRLPLLITLILTLSVGIAKAGEGMWIPMLLQYNEKEMQEMGMKISAEDIYSINHSSLKDAIVLFGGGCTGEIVSDYGLLLTNHHCGYDYIQKHSSVEHDYLTNGFWAMNRGEELPCPGLSVTFLREMRDVTERVLEGITIDTPEDERKAKVDENMKKIIAEVEKETRYKVSIKPFFQGNEYYLLLNEVYTDVRLVGCPPSNIGKFGGDTDNWVWPRHTGDFSIFRVYADKDGHPAVYDKDNVPYKPVKHLDISLKGVEEGDFAFVFGYPARTNEYLPAVAVDQEANVIDPVMVDLRGKVLDIYNKYQEQDPKVRIQYASKHAGLGNGWKKWMGVTEGINHFHGIERKMDYESSFYDWVMQSRSRYMYANLLKDFKSNYKTLEPYQLAYTYMAEAGRRIELVSFAGRFTKLSEVTKETPQEDINRMVESLKKTSATFFKDYYEPIDREVAAMLLGEYLKAQPADFRPAFLNDIKDINGYVDNLFNKSMFTDEAKVNALLDGFKANDAKKLAKDPALQVYQSLIGFYRDEVYDHIVSLTNDNARLQRIYMKGQMEMEPEKHFYPDANFTLRVTYGRVEGFKPQDGKTYRHFTTLEGIMQKENPEIYDYVVEPRLKQLYINKDYGRYADKDGTMHVAFTASVHTTGGNSGSPILNSEGQLLGLNFDRCWEGTMSDLIYDPAICRNISVDIRYVLFIIDKFAGAGHLIEEMTIIE